MKLSVILTMTLTMLFLALQCSARAIPPIFGPDNSPYGPMMIPGHHDYPPNRLYSNDKLPPLSDPATTFPNDRMFAPAAVAKRRSNWPLWFGLGPVVAPLSTITKTAAVLPKETGIARRRYIDEAVKYLATADFRFCTITPTMEATASPTFTGNPEAAVRYMVKADIGSSSITHNEEATALPKLTGNMFWRTGWRRSPTIRPTPTQFTVDCSTTMEIVYITIDADPVEKRDITSTAIPSDTSTETAEAVETGSAQWVQFIAHENLDLKISNESEEPWLCASAAEKRSHPPHTPVFDNDDSTNGPRGVSVRGYDTIPPEFEHMYKSNNTTSFRDLPAALKELTSLITCCRRRPLPLPLPPASETNTNTKNTTWSCSHHVFPSTHTLRNLTAALFNAIEPHTLTLSDLLRFSRLSYFTSSSSSPSSPSKRDIDWEALRGVIGNWAQLSSTTMSSRSTSSVVAAAGLPKRDLAKTGDGQAVETIANAM